MSNIVEQTRSHDTNHSSPLFSRHTDVVAALAELGVFRVDLATGERTVHRLWQEWGLNERSLYGDERLSVVHPADRERVRAELRALQGGTSDWSQSEYRVSTPDGYRWVLSRLMVVGRRTDGAPRLIIGADYDITDRKRAEVDLRLSRAEAEFRAQEAETLRIAGAVIASTLDLNEAVLRVLDQAHLVIPYDRATVQLIEGTELRVIGSAGSGALAPGLRFSIADCDAYAAVIDRDEPVSQDNPEIDLSSCPDGDVCWFAVPLRSAAVVVGIMTFSAAEPDRLGHDHWKMACALADHVGAAVRNARLYEETRRLAVTDVLTGATTRRWFMPHASAQIEQAKRFGEPISLLMLDIDHFKQINDHYGHTKGDDVLREVGSKLRAVLRGLDAVCRYGGEEFVLLLPRTGHSVALQIAERIRRTLSEISRGDGWSPLTVSIGVATAGRDDASSFCTEELIQRADEALYQAKTSGRNRVFSANDAR